MENQTGFDLSKAICDWRKHLAECPSFRAHDLNELESHLRESVAVLQAGGLSPREAFWVARTRLGTAEELDCEFAKRNTDMVWLNRAVWMLIGFVLISTVTGMASTFTTLLILAISFASSVVGLGFATGSDTSMLGSTTAPQTAVFGLSMAVRFLALIGMLAWTWRAGRRNSGWYYRIGGWMRNEPILAAISVFLLLVFNTVSSWGASLLAIKSMSMDRYAAIFQTGWTMVIVLPGVLALALGWLLLRTQEGRTLRT